MADILALLSVVFFAVAGVCLVISVVLWVVLRIPTVIGDLSGRTAKKSIAKLRQDNEKSGVKGYRSSKVNAQRGKLTETMSKLERGEEKERKAGEALRPETGVLVENLSRQGASETTGLLLEEGEPQPQAGRMARKIQPSGGVKLEMIEEIVLIHTQECIHGWQEKEGEE